MMRMRRGLVALTLMMPLALTAGCFGGGSQEITAEFEDATGLFRGNEVGVRGVGIGNVTKVEPVGDRVQVSMKLDGDIKLPADVGAVVVSRSVATDRYVELTPAYTGGPELSGGSIPLERTQTPVEFEELLESLEQVSAAFSGPGGDAGPLNDLIKAAAENLEGNGENLGQGLEDLSELLTAIDGSTDNIRGNLENLDTLMASIAANDALIRRFTSSVAGATTMLDSQKKDIEVTFDSLSAMVKQVADFSKKNRGQISDQIDDFVSLSQAMLQHEREIVQLLRTAPLMSQNLQDAINDEGQLVMRARLSDIVPSLGQLCAASPLPLPPALCELVDFDLGLDEILNTIGGLLGGGGIL